MSPCTLQLETECKHKQLRPTHDLLGIRRKSHNMLHGSSLPQAAEAFADLAQGREQSAAAAEDKTNSIIEQQHHTDVLIDNISLL